MQPYKDFQPTGFDPKGLTADDMGDDGGDRSDWLVLGVSRTRDSGPPDESNFEQALRQLGGESESVEVHRFNHWGPGWFEIIIIKPDTPEAKIGQDIEDSLEQYPVLPCR